MSQKKTHVPQPIQPRSVLYRLLQLVAMHMIQRSQPGKTLQILTTQNHYATPNFMTPNIFSRADYLKNCALKFTQNTHTARPGDRTFPTGYRTQCSYFRKTFA